MYKYDFLKYNNREQGVVAHPMLPYHQPPSQEVGPWLPMSLTRQKTFPNLRKILSTTELPITKHIGIKIERHFLSMRRSIDKTIRRRLGSTTKYIGKNIRTRSTRKDDKNALKIPSLYGREIVNGIQNGKNAIQRPRKKSIIIIQSLFVRKYVSIVKKTKSGFMKIIVLIMRKIQSDLKNMLDAAEPINLETNQIWHQENGKQLRTIMVTDVCIVVER